MNYKNKFLTLLFTLISITTFSQDILFVDVDAAGANDGSTWTDAFTDIQTAVNNWTTGDSIWVAEGTYLPTEDESGNANPTQPKDKTFSLNTDGIQLFGGFVGTETLLSERDIPANPTILSGDLGIANDTIDNAFRVLTMNGANSLTSATRIDGFFIQDANNSGEGGGLFIFVDAGVQKEPTIANCIFRNNIASRGAAILNTGESTIQAPNNPGTVSPILINCAFFDNQATGSIKSFVFGGQAFPNNGGVVSSKMTFVNALSRPSVINCSFSGNQGGAFSTNGNTISTLENCIFWDNENLEITTIESSSATLRFSILDDGNPNGTINFPASTTGNNNLDSDPLFVDAANGDLRLQENSPAINAGDKTANALALDIDGNPRIAFDTIDMGAYETIDPCFMDMIAPVPDLVNLPNATGQCRVTLTAAPTATDDCNGLITGTTTAPTSYTEQGIFTVTWVYEDNLGNTSSQQQIVMVEDTFAPFLLVDTTSNATLPDVTGDCQVTLTAPRAGDNCGGLIVGTTDDPLTYNIPGTFNTTWTFDDGNGNSLIAEQTVIVTIGEACDDCQEDLVLPQNEIIATGSYLVEATIVASGEIESGSSVTFTAGESITLSSGFHVQSGATFNAAISEIVCSTEALIAENKLHLIAPETAINNTITEVVTLSVKPNPFHSADLQFNVFPNPTNGETKIYIELPSPTTLSIQLFDQSGKLLQQLLLPQEKSEGAFQLEIPILQLPIGMNYIILQTNERRIVRKLIRIR